MASLGLECELEELLEESSISVLEARTVLAVETSFLPLDDRAPDSAAPPLLDVMVPLSLVQEWLEKVVQEAAFAGLCLPQGHHQVRAQILYLLFPTLIVLRTHQVKQRDLA